MKLPLGDFIFWAEENYPTSLTRTHDLEAWSLLVSLVESGIKKVLKSHIFSVYIKSCCPPGCSEPLNQHLFNDFAEPSSNGSRHRCTAKLYFLGFTWNNIIRYIYIIYILQAHHLESLNSWLVFKPSLWVLDSTDSFGKILPQRTSATGPSVSSMEA